MVDTREPYNLNIATGQLLKMYSSRVFIGMWYIFHYTQILVYLIYSKTITIFFFKNVRKTMEKLYCIVMEKRILSKTYFKKEKTYCPQTEWYRIRISSYS